MAASGAVSRCGAASFHLMDASKPQNRLLGMVLNEALDLERCARRSAECIHGDDDAPARTCLNDQFLFGHAAPATSRRGILNAIYPVNLIPAECLLGHQ